MTFKDLSVGKPTHYVIILRFVLNVKSKVVSAKGVGARTPVLHLTFNAKYIMCCHQALSFVNERSDEAAEGYSWWAPFSYSIFSSF